MYPTLIKQSKQNTGRSKRIYDLRFGHNARFSLQSSARFRRLIIFNLSVGEYYLFFRIVATASTHFSIDAPDLFYVEHADYLSIGLATD